MARARYMPRIRSAGKPTIRPPTAHTIPAMITSNGKGAPARDAHTVAKAPPARNAAFPMET
ncbi:MAG TPA: hypothetical protein VHT26_10500 [Trebonia sp.]|nr:hypothetical protein [Trebonia sp.]